MLVPEFMFTFANMNTCAACGRDYDGCLGHGRDMDAMFTLHQHHAMNNHTVCHAGAWCQPRALVELDEDVKRGAELMDEIDREWFMLMNLRTLELGDADECVLGQYVTERGQAGGMSPFQIGMERHVMPVAPDRMKNILAIAKAVPSAQPWALNKATCVAIAHGFAAQRNVEYPMLDELWAGQIERRLVEA